MKSKRKKGWIHEEQDEGRLVTYRASGRQAARCTQSKRKTRRLHTEPKESRKVAYRARGRQTGNRNKATSRA